MTSEKGVGYNIQVYLERSGMTRKELAGRTGVTEAAISRYISGDREPKAVTLSAIAVALGISTDDLLGVAIEPRDEIENAMRLVARGAGKLTQDEKAFLINALLKAE